MAHTLRALAGVGFSAAVVALAACQGNIGGGSGLSIPAAPGYQQPAGPGGASAQSRERVLDGAVYLSPKLSSVPLPQVAGYAVSLALGTPGPVTEPVASPSPSTAARAQTKARVAKLTSRTGASARPSATASAVAPAAAASDVSPGPSPSAAASAAPSGGASASASASAAGSAQPKASSTASAPAAPSPSGKATRAASPAATTGSNFPRFETKTAVYPDDAPPPPTPMPTGEVQTFVKRTPIVRGYVLAGADLPLYGLGAVRFTLPTTELMAKRGFTVALFESGKHHHDRLISYDTEPTIAGSLVYSSLTSPPLTLKKGGGYLLLIYGDDEAGPPTTAPSVPPGYPAPGNNPFPAGSGAPQPGYTQVPGYPGGVAPYPGTGTAYPGTVTSTPVFGSPRP